MRTRTSPRRSAAVLLAVGSMLFVACGGSDDDRPVASSPPDEAPAELTQGGDAEPSDERAPDPTTAPPIASVPETTRATTPPTTAPTIAPSTTPAPQGDPALIESVIMPAIAAADADASFSFSMGMQMALTMDGMEITIGDADTVLATGTIEGDREYTAVHIGDFMASMLESMFAGLAASGELSDADLEVGMGFFTAMLDGFRGQTMETWVDNEAGVMVMDASEFFAGMLALEPTAGDDLGPMSVLVDGPVLVRLDEYGDAFGDVLADIGVSTGVSGPDDMLDMLRTVTDVAELGPGTVGGADVTFYTATVNLGAMYEALGVDLQQLLQGDPAAAELTAAFDGFVMDITVAVDAHGKLRRIALFADLGGVLTELEPTVGDRLGQLTMEVWQEFDRYGESFPFDPPTATDITDVFDELFESPRV